MSDQSKTKSSPSSSLPSTRQLLDELDALMERMLSLPVDGSAAATSSTAEGTATVLDRQQPATAAKTESSAAEPAENITETDVQEISNPTEPATNYQYENETEESPQAHDDPWTTDHTEEESERKTELARLKASSATEEILSSLAEPAAKILAEPLSQRTELVRGHHRRRWWLFPFTAVNCIFDVGTYLLGPLGHWLRQSGGRSFLGILGILLVVAAICFQIWLWLSWN